MENAPDMSPEEKETIFRKLREAREWGNQQPSRFLKAWKDGVKLIGTDYFKINGSLESAKTIDDLVPDINLINEVIFKLSTGQAVFLAAMVSFYDSQVGQRYLEQLGYANIADIAAKLDIEYREILKDIIFYSK